MRWITKAVAAILTLLLLVGCSSSGDTAPAHDDAGSAEMDSAGAQTIDAETDRDLTVEPEREVITTANATITVAEPDAAVDEVVQLIEEAGGRVDQRSLRAAGSQGTGSLPSAQMTLRVPADELEELLAELGQIGEVEELSQEAEDVTQAGADLDARIAALETSTERLQQIMAEADDSAALIEAEDALSRRQADLESLQSQRAHLSDQVAMSTLHLSLVARDDPTIEAGGFLGGLQSGWAALVSFASGLLVAAGVALPWLVVLAIPGVPLVLMLRRRLRRRTVTRSENATQPEQDDDEAMDT